MASAAAAPTYPFLKRYQLLRDFFVQLREQAMTSNSPAIDSLEEEEEDQAAPNQQDASDSVRKEDPNPTNTYTQREFKSATSRRQNRATYLSNKKKPPAPEHPQLRPSDILAFESNKKIIDQLCRDNNILNKNLQDALKVIETLSQKIKHLQSQTNQELQLQIKKLQQLIQTKDSELQIKQQTIVKCRNKFETLQKQLSHTFQEIEDDQLEQEKSIIAIQTQNTYLRKLLGIRFSEDQLQLIEKQQDEAEFNFYDNFCISRKDLEKKAIEQYEKVLSQRRQKIETQFIDWHVVYMNEQQKQQEKYIANQANFPPNQDFLMYQDDPEENLYQQPKPKPKQVTKEEKDRILQELLKPIGGSNKQQQKLKDLTSASLEDSQLDNSNQKSEGIIRNKAMMHGDMALEAKISPENEFIPSRKQPTEQEDENEENAKASTESKSSKDKNKLSLQIDLIEKSDPKPNKNQQELKPKLNVEDYEIEDSQEYNEASESPTQIKKEEDHSSKLSDPPQSESQSQQTGFKKTQKEIMQSLEQGWQKLLQSKQQRNSKSMSYEDDDNYGEEPFTYQGFPGNNIFCGPKTINYDQDDYFDDEDEDEIYQNIMQKQKILGSKLQKTSKNEELQNRTKK